ncbi:NIL domain-containing protein [Pedobacter rhizosphaerae]|uniref:NIL domain-containing protein n=1 Tax=Pedobacter rhizosphaerae TaxID=390241 RepID=A0A1H9U0Z8_9SPHI|nr:NIL domain-containing protein [Pedobacter rhizosphaerae]SES02881.1 NIL domain-containing protein [Pedobacter rhizosphaerae]
MSQHLSNRQIAPHHQVLNLPLSYQERLKANPDWPSKQVFKLEVHGSSNAEAILSEIAQRFSVRSQVVVSQIEQISGVRYGSLIVEIAGHPWDQKLAIDHCRCQGLSTQLLGYV